MQKYKNTNKQMQKKNTQTYYYIHVLYALASLKHAYCIHKNNKAIAANAPSLPEKFAHNNNNKNNKQNSSHTFHYYVCIMFAYICSMKVHLIFVSTPNNVYYYRNMEPYIPQQCKQPIIQYTMHFCIYIHT